MSAYDLSLLSIPAQHPAEPGTFDARPKSITAWINALPMANLGETSRRVFKALVELNRVELPVRQRLQILELLLQPADYVSVSLEKHYAGRPLPLNEKHRKISELSRALLTELATGYKIVARSLGSEQVKPDRNMAMALHRAMYYLGVLLLRSYQIYAPYPKQAWLELNGMYRYAEHYKLLDMKFPLPTTDNRECSLADIYKHSILLSLAMPYSLLRGEIDIVANNLCWLVGDMHIKKIPDYSKPDSLFIIDLKSNNHPVYLSLFAGNDYNHCRAINMTDLLQNMASISDRIPADLMRRLQNAWSVMPKRSFSRTSNGCVPVEVAFGLSAAHYFVSGEVDFTSELPQEEQSSYSIDSTSAFTSTFIRNEGDQQTGPDVWSNLYSYSENDPNNAPPSTTVLNQRSGAQQIMYTKHTLEMHNTSAGGYCLSTPNNTNIAAHVGDLLAIREQHNIDIDQWGIGVIRRMQSMGNNAVELGVQMLTPNAVAVAARIIGGNGSAPASEYMRCLMLPELRAINQPATLITPVLPFKQGSHIYLNICNREYEATLNQVREKTHGYIQFEFTMQEAAAAEAAKAAGPDKGSEADFDSLWDSL